MRVDLNAANAVPENNLQSGAPVRPGSAESKPTSDEGSQFSSGTAGVSTLASVALHAPDVRQAKVEALREQIASGNYAVSSQQIAASILEQLRTHSQSGH